MVLSCVSSVWPQCGPETLGGALVPRRWIWVSVCPLDSMAFCVVLGIEFRASCMLGKPWSQIPAAIGMYLKGFKQNNLACEHRDSQSWRGVFYPAPRAVLALWDFPRPAFCVFRLYLWASPPASWFPRSLFCIWPFHPQLGEPTLFPVSGEAVFSWPLTSFLSLHHIHACPSCGLLVPRLRTGTLGCIFSPPFSLSVKSCHHTVPFAGAVMSLVA